MEYNVEIAVGKRFYTSRNLLLLTKNEVELITKMPKTSLSRIENGILPSNPKWTDVLSNLYQISKADIYNVEKPLPDWKTLKRRVLAAHKNNLNLVIALEKKPKPKIAIQYRVLKSDFLNDFKTASSFLPWYIQVAVTAADGAI